MIFAALSFRDRVIRTERTFRLVQSFMFNPLLFFPVLYALASLPIFPIPK